MSQVMLAARVPDPSALLNLLNYESAAFPATFLFEHIIHTYLVYIHLYLFFYKKKQLTRPSLLPRNLR